MNSGLQIKTKIIKKNNLKRIRVFKYISDTIKQDFYKKILSNMYSIYEVIFEIFYINLIRKKEFFSKIKILQLTKHY